MYMVGDSFWKPRSDYMGGHHAGKFDFDPRLSGVTSLNYEGSKIFDASTEGTEEILADVPTEGEPLWATRVVGVHGKVTGGMIVRNEEISWESFYASIERMGENGEVLGRYEGVVPRSGCLAPRGGAKNACDESRPYADSWELTVDATRVLGEMEEMDVGRGQGRFYMVVRTEQDYWCWPVVIG